MKKVLLIPDDESDKIPLAYEEQYVGNTEFSYYPCEELDTSC